MNQVTGKDRQITKKKEIHEIAQAATKNIKTEKDLNEFRAMLTKIIVDAPLNAELDDHLTLTHVPVLENTLICAIEDGLTTA